MLPKGFPCLSLKAENLASSVSENELPISCQRHKWLAESPDNLLTEISFEFRLPNGLPRGLVYCDNMV